MLLSALSLISVNLTYSSSFFPSNIHYWRQASVRTRILQREFYIYIYTHNYITMSITMFVAILASKWTH